MTKSIPSLGFNPACRDCPRLAKYLDRIREDHPGYYARPVPSFGPERAELLVVGLAPGMHGANRTGRPFTGDYAGILLYRTLYKYGFGSHPGSDDPSDGLRLFRCRITNAIKCVPPGNKPLTEEVRRCNHYLADEIAAVRPRALLALGAVAHRAVLLTLGEPASKHPFAHGAVHVLDREGRSVRLYDSYHCSRYNTQTKRLTAAGFEAVFRRIAQWLRGKR